MLVQKLNGLDISMVMKVMFVLLDKFFDYVRNLLHGLCRALAMFLGTLF